MISSIEDIDEHILYLFTDWASRKIFNEKLKKKTWRYWWKWIWLVYIDDKYETRDTNNDMELGAVIDWLKYLSKNEIIDNYHKIIVATDSDYVYSNWNRALYHRSWKWWNNSSWFWLAHKKERKDFFKIYKELNKLWVYCSCERVKWHNWNEFNDKADKSAVKWAQSKNKVSAETRRWIRMPFLEELKFDDNIEINWSKWLLIHVTNYLWWLWKNRKRFICEIVNRKNPYFRYRFYINTNKSLSSEYIYNVDIWNDKFRHIIENINWKYSKKEIKDKMLKAGLWEEIFYKSKIRKKQ